MRGRINTDRAVEDELRVRSGGGQRQPGGADRDYWEFRGKGAGRRLHRLGRRSSGRSSGTDPRQQRVVVKAAYTVHKAGSARGVLAAHARYLARDSASLDGREGRFYDAGQEGVDAKPLAAAWTWLDRQLYLRAAGKPTAVPFDQELETAAAARQRWMVEHGHAQLAEGRYALRPGAQNALREQEWRAASPDLRRRFGGTPERLRPGGHVAGTYRGTVALHAGLHAAVADGGRLHLAPVERVPPLAAGAAVRASVSAAGRGILVAGRHADLDEGRG